MNETNINTKIYEPFISLCTVTYNRRPYIKIIEEIVNNFDYPKKKMEWIIIDDGDDNIEELIINNPIVKYYRYDYKIPLGAKRNISNKLANGNIIFYIDDDDYYYPNRIKKTLEMFTTSNKKYFIGGSKNIKTYSISKDIIYDYKLDEAPGCSLVFLREYMLMSSFKNNDENREEKNFLKDFSILNIENVVINIDHGLNTANKESISNKLINSIDTNNIKKYIPENYLLMYKNAAEEMKEYNKNIKLLKEKEEKESCDIIVYTSYIGSLSWYVTKKIAEILFDKKYKILFNKNPKKVNNYKIILYDNETSAINYKLNKLECKKIFIAYDYKDYSWLDVDLLIDTKKYYGTLLYAKNITYIPNYLLTKICLTNNLINRSFRNKKSKKNSVLINDLFISRKIATLINLLTNTKIKLDIINSSIKNINYEISNKKINYYEKNNKKPNLFPNLIELFSKYKFVLCCDNEVQMNFCKEYITYKIMLCLISGSIPIYIGSEDINKHFNEECFINFNNYENIDIGSKNIELINTLMCNDDKYNKYINVFRNEYKKYSYMIYMNKIKNIIKTII